MKTDLHGHSLAKQEDDLVGNYKILSIYLGSILMCSLEERGIVPPVIALRVLVEKSHLRMMATILVAQW